MAEAKVFLDVGGHVGETLTVAMEPQWGFDRIWTFEPASACRERLQALADERVTVVPAGLWSSDTTMELHDPGTLHASVDAAASRHGQTEECRFIDAATWMAEHVRDGDRVWMKVNVEAAEVEVLGRLLDSGELGKVDHLAVHFDVEKVGRGEEAVPLRRRLDASGVAWKEAGQVMFGRTDSAKIATWLAFTHGQRWRFWREKAEHVARRKVWRARERLRGSTHRPR